MPVADTLFSSVRLLDPASGIDQHGDLLVRVLIDVPQHLEPEEKKLYEELRKLQRSVSAM